MSEPTTEELVTFAGVLEAFVAAQRAAALGEVRKQRITVSRHVGDMNIAYELVVDEGSGPGEIFDLMNPIDGALDRLKAKMDLSSHYERMANFCGQIEMSMKKIATDRVKFQAENAVRNERRREPIVLTTQQRAALEQHREAIRDSFERIEELKKAAAECRRVIGGEDPFAVLDNQIAQRLDELRGERPDAA